MEADISLARALRPAGLLEKISFLSQEKAGLPPWQAMSVASTSITINQAEDLSRKSPSRVTYCLCLL